MKRKTHNQYIQECINKNLDLPLDSPDNKYQTCETKLLHICKNNKSHPNYLRTPSEQLNGSGLCPICSAIKISINTSKSYDQYVKDCKTKEYDLH